MATPRKKAGGRKKLPARQKRATVVHVRVNDDEHAMLIRVAGLYGLDLASTLRLLVREKDRATGGSS